MSNKLEYQYQSEHITLTKDIVEEINKNLDLPSLLNTTKIQEYPTKIQFDPLSNNYEFTKVSLTSHN